MIMQENLTRNWFRIINQSLHCGENYQFASWKTTVESYFEANMSRKLKLSEREKGFIDREADKHPLSTSAEIMRATGPVGSKIHASIIRRTLLQAGQVSYRPKKKPLMTVCFKKLRREWVRRFRNFTLEQWQKVRNYIRFKKKVYLIFNFLNNFQGDAELLHNTVYQQ